MPYRRRFNSYNRNRGMGTRYASTRRITGLYRSPARYRLGGRARRVFGRRGSFKRALRSVAEKKYGDTAVNFGSNTINAGAPAVTDTALTLGLTPVIAGTTDNNRIGDKVTGTSLEVNYSIYPEEPGSPGVPAMYDPQPFFQLRVLIFIWKDDTAPSAADITDQNVGIVAGVLQPMAPLDHDRKVKRKILYDKTHTLVAGVNSGVYPGVSNATPMITRRFSIPLTKLRNGLDTINYFGGTTTGVNNIYLLLNSNVPAATSVLRGWTTEVYFRYNFIDM